MALVLVEDHGARAVDFQALDPAEVDWCLREHVGCGGAAADGRNLRFGSGLEGGRGVWEGASSGPPYAQLKGRMYE